MEPELWQAGIMLPRDTERLWCDCMGNNRNNIPSMISAIG